MDTPADLVTVKEAAELLGIKRQTLDKKLRARGLQVVRRVQGGRVLVFLQRAWLPALAAPAISTSSTDQQAGQHRSAPDQPLQPPQQAAQADEAARLRDEVERLRVALDAAQAARMELAGKLAGAEFVERATARRCDRLEERLDNAHRLALDEAKRHGEAFADLAASHARELGRRDLIVAGLREKVEQSVDRAPWWWPRVFGR
jgi:excisionase family DNA binding protein